MKINKEIYSIKMFITTDCIQQCKYCFVNKDKKYMNCETAFSAINLLISSPGKEKVLRLYGGEPLLNFDLIKKITPFAYETAKKHKKKLVIAMCTNGILLNEEHIDLFHKYNFKLGISLDGDKKTHESLRVDSEGKGYFDIINIKLSLLLKRIDKRNLDAELVVTPDTVVNLYNNFRFVLSLGFDTICVAPSIGTTKWNPYSENMFFLNMLKIRNYILQEAKKGNFIYILTLNQELVNKTLSKTKEGLCHFYRWTEILPNGDVGFSAFLMHSQDKDRYAVGNVNTHIKEQYRSCQFNNDQNKCRQCIANYFVNLSRKMNIYKIRNVIIGDLAKNILNKSKTNVLFKKYISEAKEHIHF